MQPLPPRPGQDEQAVLGGGKQGIAQLQVPQHQLGKGPVCGGDGPAPGHLRAAIVLVEVRSGGQLLQSPVQDAQHRVEAGGHGTFGADAQLIVPLQMDRQPDADGGRSVPAIALPHRPDDERFVPVAQHQLPVPVCCPAAHKYAPLLLLIGVKHLVPAHKSAPFPLPPGLMPAGTASPGPFGSARWPPAGRGGSI